MALFGLGKKKDPYHDHMMTLLVHKPDADKLPLVIDVETGETIAKSIAFTMKADARRIASSIEKLNSGWMGSRAEVNLA